MDHLNCRDGMFEGETGLSLGRLTTFYLYTDRRYISFVSTLHYSGVAWTEGAAPKWTRKKSDHKMLWETAGKTLELRCPAEGDPPLTIRWLKDKQPLTVRYLGKVQSTMLPYQPTTCFLVWCPRPAVLNLFRLADHLTNFFSGRGPPKNFYIFSGKFLTTFFSHFP